jgi:hypothetical protein
VLGQSGNVDNGVEHHLPIATDETGSLVHVAFHVKPGGNPDEATTVQLVDSKIVLADDQAALILSPGLDWTMVLTNGWVESRP